jgi:hypothetical protein
LYKSKQSQPAWHSSWAKEFDRLFPGVQFSEVDGDILFVFAQDEETAAEMEDSYALHISIDGSSARSSMKSPPA